MSGGSLNDERFIADAFAMLRHHDRAAKKICLEITESVAVSDIENMTKFADQARSLGCRLALDDFGVGYTSFSYLSRLPVDVLKIDGSLVSRALSHPTNLSIIESIAGLTRNLGMTSIAEWTDDLDTVKAMVEAGLDYIQAFIIAEPQLPSAILLATSAADFIKDPDVEHYVRTFLGGHDTQDLWATGVGSRSGDLH
jgi:EAL domain-containing protein (putative c-di-GMP-specific phosphodiesterase class I)